MSHDDLSYRPIKDELENDEEFFKITSGYTRNMSHCDGYLYFYRILNYRFFLVIKMSNLIMAFKGKGLIYYC